jgi:hypothetical protein
MLQWLRGDLSGRLLDVGTRGVLLRSFWSAMQGAMRTEQGQRSKQNHLTGRWRETCRRNQLISIHVGGLEEMLTLASSEPKECSRCSLAGACQWKGRQCGGLGEDQLGRIDASTISESCEAQEMGAPPSFAKHRLLVLFQGSFADRVLEGSARARQR